MPKGIFPRTENQRRNIGIAVSGENNGNWNGGVSGIRRIKITRDKCSWCGAKKNIVVHHKDKNRRNNKMSNLVVICQPCHARHHMMGNKNLLGKTWKWKTKKN